MQQTISRKFAIFHCIHKQHTQKTQNKDTKYANTKRTHTHTHTHTHTQVFSTALQNKIKANKKINKHINVSEILLILCECFGVFQTKNPSKFEL